MGCRLMTQTNSYCQVSFLEYLDLYGETLNSIRLKPDRLVVNPENIYRIIIVGCGLIQRHPIF